MILGTVRELAFIQATKNAGLDVFHSKQGDYQIDQFTFEIGGKNKNRKHTYEGERLQVVISLRAEWPDQVVDRYRNHLPKYN